MSESMTNITAHTLAGQQLPKDWQYQCKAVAASADAAYLDRITNAWRGNLTTSNNSIIANAQLSRGDSRLDGLKLVREEDDFEVWESAGVRVVRKK
tara:strand:- start:633 stop:920 length:288 start_codon:yes stop_codon:yes gene_type:complete